jgi:hypothetical protein
MFDEPSFAPVREAVLARSKCDPPLASFFGFRSRTLMFFFFVFCILTFLSWVICCFTEQQLTPANDVLFWDQVIEADQFFLPALWPLTR